MESSLLQQTQKRQRPPPPPILCWEGGENEASWNIRGVLLLLKKTSWAVYKNLYCCLQIRARLMLDSVSSGKSSEKHNPLLLKFLIHKGNAVPKEEERGGQTEVAMGACREFNLILRLSTTLWIPKGSCNLSTEGQSVFH